ncbi:MAG: cysteine hydrolase family protein [Kordiimonas sp.]
MTSQETALLIIDVQKAMDHPKWGNRNNPDAEKVMEKLLAFWRANTWPVVHIQDNSPDPKSPYHQGQPLHDFKPEVMPLENELVVGKTTGNAFVETELLDALNERQICQLVVCGVHIQHCVDCTVRMAASFGFKVTLVSDGTVATEVTDTSGKLWVADDVHALALTHLSSYASIKNSAEIIV